jgi:uncharacterized OsmC-like protein
MLKGKPRIVCRVKIEGSQEFWINIHLDSKTATKEQLEKLYELGKRFSPAMDTLTHGTTIKTTYKK